MFFFADFQGVYSQFFRSVCWALHGVAVKVCELGVLHLALHEGDRHSAKNAKIHCKSWNV